MKERKYIHFEDKKTVNFLNLYIKRLSKRILKQRQIESFSDIVVICIGTDRSTGDSLGPFTGMFLKEKKIKNLHIFGTIENPVHAKNIHEITDKINESFNKESTLFIAIDASVGDSEKAGYIGIGDQPLNPGSGVDKDLPELGDIAITGIMAIFTPELFSLVLGSTRLYKAVSMAKSISSAIEKSIYSVPGPLYENKEKSLIA